LLCSRGYAGNNIFALEKGIWKPLIWMIYACLIDRNGPGSDVLIGVLADCFITINVWNQKGFQRHLNQPTPIKLMSKKWYTKLSSLIVSTVVSLLPFWCY
jgi:hypothetical protein